MEYDNYNIDLKGAFDVYSNNLDKTQTASLNKFVSNELLKKFNLICEEVFQYIKKIINFPKN